MTFEQAFMALLAITSGVLGWLGRELWAAVQMLRRDLGSLETRIGSDYIRYDRLQDLIRPLSAKLDRIEELLAHKVDK
jgi:hypothetical protein